MKLKEWTALWYSLVPAGLYVLAMLSAFENRKTDTILCFMAAGLFEIVNKLNDRR